MEQTLHTLLSQHALSTDELRKLHLASSDDYEKKLLSMANRVSRFFSLTYGDEYTIAWKNGILCIVFTKYSGINVTQNIYVTHTKNVNEYTITLKDDNSITYVNPYYVERTLIEFFKG